MGSSKAKAELPTSEIEQVPNFKLLSAKTRLLWKQEEQFQKRLSLTAGHLSARGHWSDSNRIGKFSTLVFLKAQRRLLQLGLLAGGPVLARTSNCLLEQLRGVTCNAGWAWCLLGEENTLNCSVKIHWNSATSSFKGGSHLHKSH